MTDPTTTLGRLPYPVYFVNKHAARFGDLMGARSTLPAELAPWYERCIDGVDVWSALTYLHLRQRGLRVRLVSRFVPGRICVVGYHHLAVRDVPFNSYVVACRLDCPRPEICEQQTVMNGLSVRGPNDHFVPHWPQPTLRPRDPGRGCEVGALDFKGGASNLAGAFREASFHARLREMGVEFSTDATKAADKSVEQYRYWADFTRTDAVLAVRDMSDADARVKPAAKLINAWHAGCPALLGPEPAYRALRRSELDYFEIRTPDDVLDALRRLKAFPGLYRAMVENGFERAKEFSADRIAARWRDLLAGPIAEGYGRWRRASWVQRGIGRPVRFFTRAIRHRREVRAYVRERVKDDVPNDPGVPHAPHANEGSRVREERSWSRDPSPRSA